MTHLIPDIVINVTTGGRIFDFNITKSTKLSINVAGKMAYRNKALDDSNPFYAILTSPTSVYPVKYSDGEWGR